MRCCCFVWTCVNYPTTPPPIHTHSALYSYVWLMNLLCGLGCIPRCKPAGFTDALFHNVPRTLGQNIHTSRVRPTATNYSYSPHAVVSSCVQEPRKSKKAALSELEQLKSDQQRLIRSMLAAFAYVRGLFFCLFVFDIFSFKRRPFSYMSLAVCLRLHRLRAGPVPQAQENVARPTQATDYGEGATKTTAVCAVQPVCTLRSVADILVIHTEKRARAV